MSTPSSRITLAVKGMTCDGCTANVKRILELQVGVASALVTLHPPHAVVQYDPDAVTPQELASATEEIGFPSTPLTGGDTATTPTGGPS